MVGGVLWEWRCVAARRLVTATEQLRFGADAQFIHSNKDGAVGSTVEETLLAELTVCRTFSGEFLHFRRHDCGMQVASNS